MMKKLLIVIISLYISATTFAQISATGQHKAYKTFKDIDILFVFDGIDTNSSLKYAGAYNSINWYKFSDPTSSISNQSENFNIENATGYIVDVDGVKSAIWVIDYQQYLAVFRSLEVEYAPKSQCAEINLLLDADINEIEYKTVDGIAYKIDRVFTVSYQSKEWNATTVEWDDKELSTEFVLPQSVLSLYTVPLCDTRFKLEGDRFAQDLGLAQLPTIESNIYSAVSVEAHITSSVAMRTEDNEGDRPTVATELKGSGPLDITFMSNANLPIAEFYRWEVFKNNSLLAVRNEQDMRYTFDEAGNYTVKLTASNSYCNYADSVMVDITESAIQVPYAFTPNGDGINDEFRVAYKSLTSFRGWIYNRWGRKVFYWTDPQKGWDGKINGKEASEGAYIYVIEAVGADKKEYKLKGTTNLLRGVK